MSAPTQFTEVRPAALSADSAEQADVIVVGAGPAGSSAAYWLARAGLDVALAGEDDLPPREGLRRRADPARHPSAGRHGHRRQRGAGWLHNRGLRVIGGGQRLHLDWPELTSFPHYGLVRPRADLDALLAAPGRQGRRPTARADTAINEPILDAHRPGGRGVGAHRRPATGRVPGPLVLTCEGVVRQARPATRRPPQRQAAARRRGAALLHQPEDPRRLPRVVARAVGRQAERRRTCCPATAGSSAWATAPSTPASAC